MTDIIGRAGHLSDRLREIPDTSGQNGQNRRTLYPPDRSGQSGSPSRLSALTAARSKATKAASEEICEAIKSILSEHGRQYCDRPWAAARVRIILQIPHGRNSGDEPLGQKLALSCLIECEILRQLSAA
ncbi:MAG: hypothetical protein AAF583_15660 [Pseudomonadota bacterium]